MVNQFFDFNAIEEETGKADELTILYDKWKYESPMNEFDTKCSQRPSHLNQTQVIRFDTVLGRKSYE